MTPLIGEQVHSPPHFWTWTWRSTRNSVTVTETLAYGRRNPVADEMEWAKGLRRAYFIFFAGARRHG